MAIQTRYTKNGHSFDCEVTPEFQAAYDATVAAYPFLGYPIDMGVKQSTSDSYAGKTDPAAIEGAGRKKWDAIMRGEVRVAASGDRQPTRSAMEREVWKIAAGELAEIFEKLKVPKANQAVYIRQLVDRDWDRLEDLAQIARANQAAIAKPTFEALDALYAMAAEPTVEETVMVDATGPTDESPAPEPAPVEVVAEPEPEVVVEPERRRGRR